MIVERDPREGGDPGDPGDPGDGEPGYDPQFDDWDIEDLRLIPSEDFEDEDGPGFCVYSLKMDALTWVFEPTVRALRARGIGELDAVPGGEDGS